MAGSSSTTAKEPLSPIRSPLTQKGIYRHRYVPAAQLLELPGLIDLSYFVDFQALDYVVRSNELHSWTLSQAEFLKAMGLETRVEMLRAGCRDEETKRVFAQQIDRLTAPGQMGSIYKFFFFAAEELYPFGEGSLTRGR